MIEYLGDGRWLLSNRGEIHDLVAIIDRIRREFSVRTHRVLCIRMADGQMRSEIDFEILGHGAPVEAMRNG